MKKNLFTRIGALAMTAVMAFSMAVGVSAANEANATIDTSIPMTFWWEFSPQLHCGWRFIVGGVSIANFLLEKEVDLHETDPGRKRDNRDV